jgi:hypothetical protein
MHEREAARQNAPGDSDASALALERDLGSAEPDRVLFPALIRVALGLLECRAGHGPTEAALVQRARAIGLLAAPSRKP